MNRRIAVLQTAALPLGYAAQKKMERETGFEPATSTLARSHSTTELFPLNLNLSFNYLFSFCQQKSLILEKSSELKKIVGTGPDSKAKRTPQKECADGLWIKP